MKRQWIKQAAFLILLGASVPALAQQEGGQADQRREERAPREVPSPENRARHISREIQQTLSLTDEVREEIYDLYLTEQRAGLPEGVSGQGMPPRGGMGMPPQGGMGGPGMPPQGGMGMPPQGGPGGPEMNGESDSDRQEQMEKMQKKREKAYKKLDKKMKKLLTDGQYSQWKSLDAEWREQTMKPQRRPDGPQEPRLDTED